MYNNFLRPTFLCFCVTFAVVFLSFEFFFVDILLWWRKQVQNWISYMSLCFKNLEYKMHTYILPNVPSLGADHVISLAWIAFGSLCV